VSSSNLRVISACCSAHDEIEIMRGAEPESRAALPTWRNYCIEQHMRDTLEVVPLSMTMTREDVGGDVRTCSTSLPHTAPWYRPCPPVLCGVAGVSLFEGTDEI